MYQDHLYDLPFIEHVCNLKIKILIFEINNRGSNLLRHRVLRACSNRGSVICIRGARRSRE